LSLIVDSYNLVPLCEFFAGGFSSPLLVHGSRVKLDHAERLMAGNRGYLMEAAPGLGQPRRSQFAKAVDVAPEWEAFDLGQRCADLLGQIGTDAPWLAELGRQDRLSGGFFMPGVELNPPG
jgi:hypothetical protein